MRRHSTVGEQPPQVQLPLQTSRPQESPFAHGRVSPGAQPLAPLQLPNAPHAPHMHVAGSHERVRMRGRVGTMCAAPGACESAELSFYIHEDGR